MILEKLSPALAESIFPLTELDQRPVPPMDAVRDKLAIQELARRMVDEPEAVLPRFVELAMEISGGVSAGLSILEADDGGAVFRWRHLHGSLSAFEDALTPRDFSPCGVTLDRQQPVLAIHAERVYGWISDANIVVPEVLLVPLRGGKGELLGTLWNVSERAGHFHQGHAQSLTELAAFVAIALQMITSERRLKAALEEQSLIAQEMNHRVKNLFAITDGIIRTSVRSADSKEALAESLSGRLHALASAHSLVSRHFSKAGAAPRASDVASVVEAVLKPHGQYAGEVSPFQVEGPHVGCGDRCINGVALTFHELATNAVKYGALSTAGGAVAVRWEVVGEDLVMTWAETGGPPVHAPTTQGFGGVLIRNTIERQFGGSADYDWREDGLRVTLRIPLRKIAD